MGHSGGVGSSNVPNNLTKVTIQDGERKASSVFYLWTFIEVG